jgi:alpha-tubulin suppressor-like RCC1 family protein
MSLFTRISILTTAILLFAGVDNVFAFTATVQTAGNKPIAGVAVTFAFFDTTVYSDTNGLVSFVHHVSVLPNVRQSRQASLRVSNRNVSFCLPSSGPVDLRLYTLSGRTVFSLSKVLAPGTYTLTLPALAQGIYILKAMVGTASFVRKINSFSVYKWLDGPQVNAAAAQLRKTAAAADTAIFTKSGYVTVRRSFAGYGDDLGSVIMDSMISQGTAEDVSAGNAYTMIIKQDGSLWAIGENSYGQFGTGNTTYSSDTVIPVMKGVSAVFAGGSQSMILKQDATLWMTGRNSYGQLGTGDTITKRTPFQVASAVRAASGGYGHTLVLKLDSTLWAMGRNNLGQLGDGTDTNRYVPAKVADKVIAIAAGGDHSLFVKQDGTLWAMGENYYGELGDGTFIEKHSPVRIASGVCAVFSGLNHSLYLKQDNTLWAMGDNIFGQLGTGDKTGRNAPVQVAANVVSASAGSSHTMILKQDHTLWACGGNSYGQLATGDTLDRNVPAQVMAGVSVVSVGADFTAIVKSDGTVWETANNYIGSYPIRKGTLLRIVPTLYVGLTVSGGTGSGSYLPGTKLTISAHDSTATHRGFGHWAGPDSARLYVYSFDRKQADIYIPNQDAPLLVNGVFYDLPLLTVNSGTGTGWYDSGQAVTITAYDSTSQNRAFIRWGGPDSILVGSQTSPTTTVKMPFKPVTITARFGGAHALTVLNGTGSGEYYAGNREPISANDSTPANRGFYHWGGPDSACVSSISSRTTTVTMPDKAATVAAVYADLHRLTMSGGSGSGNYVQGTINIEAFDSTASHRAFDHWGGPDSALVLNDTLQQTKFIMPDRAAAIGAVNRDMYPLTVTEGTYVGSGWYYRGQRITVTANNYSASQRYFDHWGGPDSVCVYNDTMPDATITMPAHAASIIAVYCEKHYLTVKGGYGSGWYDKKTSVTINDSIGSSELSLQLKIIFDHWGGPDSVLVVNDTLYRTWFRMPSRDAAISAIYVSGCMITFDKNGGDTDAAPKQIGLVPSGRHMPVWPKPPFRKGYCFAGWNLAWDGSGAWFSETSILVADMTVYAQWENFFSGVDAGGYDHSMVLGKNGVLWAMGRDFAGNFGIPTSDADFLSPIIVASDVSAYSAGQMHTMIIKKDMTLWGTGWNMDGELGDGTTNDRYGLVPITSAVASVSAGWGHTLIVKQDGTLWATGTNQYGQLGVGAQVKGAVTPMQIMAGISAVSAGGEQSLVVKQDGTLWAFGRNLSGQLGTGDTVPRFTPVKVMAGVSAVATGTFHTFIVKQDSTLWACGENRYGQLGDGTTMSRYTPAFVMSGVKSASAGSEFSMILKYDGSLWAVGRNDHGQLGDKTTIDRYSPICLSALGKVSAVVAAYDFTLFLKQDGTVWATGRNYYGELGDGTKIERTTPIQVMPRP